MEELFYELAFQLFKVDQSEQTLKLLKKVKKLDPERYKEITSGLDVEDLVNRKPKKKKLNSGVKGKSAERSICKILNERFADILAKNKEWGEFHRVIGSGAHGHGNLSANAKELYSGDILCDHCKFVIESKNGYDDIDLVNAFSDGSRELDEFLAQVTSDSKRCGKKPLLIWKKTRKPRLAFVHNDIAIGTPCMYYKEWIAVSLEQLLTLPDEFFF